MASPDRTRALIVDAGIWMLQHGPAVLLEKQLTALARANLEV